TTTRFFHGTANDDVNRTLGTPSATFSTAGPGSTDRTQEPVTPISDSAFAGDPASAFWTGSYTGTINGTVDLDWWWSSVNPTASPAATVDVTVWADPDLSAGTGTLIGLATSDVAMGTSPTEAHTSVPVKGVVAHTLLIQA